MTTMISFHSQLPASPLIRFSGRSSDREKAGVSAEILSVSPKGLLGTDSGEQIHGLTQAAESLGLDVTRQTLAQDKPRTVRALVQEALARVNVLFLTGGRPPHQILASGFKPVAETEDSFGSVGVWASKKSKAGNPQKILVSLAGAGKDIKRLWADDILPKLLPLLPSNLSASPQTRFNVVGLTAAEVADKLDGLPEVQGLKVKILENRRETTVLLTVGKKTKTVPENAFSEAATAIRERLGDACYGDSGKSLEEVVAGLLKAKKWTVSTAESCTGGLISARLTDVSGSSDYTRLNVVTYHENAKKKMVYVAPKTIREHTVYSAQVAAEMAQGLLKRAKTDIGVSISGLAGFAEGERVPGGTAFIALSGLTDAPVVKKVFVDPAQYSRKEIKHRFSQHALNYLRLYLEGTLKGDAF